MEIKKSPKADLRNKRGLMLEIGLIVSLLAVIGAFAYTPGERAPEPVVLGNFGPVASEMVEITRQEDPKPQVVKKAQINVITDVLKVVDNTEKIDTEVDFQEFTEGLEVIDQIGTSTEEVVVEEAPFVIVEDMPSFMGGDLSKFRAWVQERVRYPAIAQENGIFGRVTVSFVIEKDGSLTNIEVMQTPDRSLSEETIRVLKLSPKWTPGKQRGSAVRVKYILPVDYRIAQ